MPKRLSLLILLPAVFLAAVAGLFAGGLLRQDPGSLPSVMVGRPPPPLSIEGFGSSDPFTLDDLLSPEVKLVNFWASWCQPCVAEHPSLAALSRQGIKIYGVNYKDQERSAERFLENLGNPFWSLGRDSSGRTGIDWGVYGIPETFIIDASGKITHRFAGPITSRALEGSFMAEIQKAQAAGAN